MSSQRAVDEETPLLEHEREQPRKARTPLPWRQFSIILFLQLAEPLTSQVISPFAPQLIRDIGITHGDESKVGHYVGLMHSLFFATQALTVLHWSRVSDHVGRKPVILTGLFGLSLSMYCFGLSKTFVGLVMSRALNGALNGNIGVIKSMMVEITDETSLPQAYAYMPIAWSTGGTLGPLIGGALSRPADRFPNVFGTWEFFKEHPYFLACAVPATFSALAWVVTFLFLKETVPTQWSLSRLFKRKEKEVKAALASPTGSAETLAPSETPAKDEAIKPLPLRQLLVPRVIIAAGNYAALSLVDIAFRAIQPLFFATPIELGGLGLDPPRIGTILAVYGIVNGLTQIFFFADLNDRLGTKTLYTISIASGVPLMITFPIINAMVRVQGLSAGVWIMIGVQVMLSVLLNLAYASIFIFIAAASPNRASLGATNGMAQMVVSIMRAIGPASSTSTFSFSIREHQDGWLAYCFLMVLVVIALVGTTFLPRRMWRD